MATITNPFQGYVLYSVETSYSTPPSKGTAYVSDVILDAKISTGDMQKPIWGISQPSLYTYISQPSDYTLHLEWVSQATTKSLATACINRWGGLLGGAISGDLPSLEFMICNNSKATGGTAAKTYVKVKGAKNKSITYTAKRGEAIIWSADFSVASVITSTTLPVGYSLKKYQSLASLNSTRSKHKGLAVFNNAGSITKTGGTSALITDSLTFTLNNGLTDLWNCTNKWKRNSKTGKQEITGSCDWSFEDGGKVALDEVIANTILTTIRIDTGMPGRYASFTLNQCRWKNTDLDINLENNAMITPVPFQAQSITVI